MGISIYIGYHGFHWSSEEGFEHSYDKTFRLGALGAYREND